MSAFTQFTKVYRWLESFSEEHYMTSLFQPNKIKLILVNYVLLENVGLTSCCLRHSAVIWSLTLKYKILKMCNLCHIFTLCPSYFWVLGFLGNWLLKNLPYIYLAARLHCDLDLQKHITHVFLHSVFSISCGSKTMPLKTRLDHKRRTRCCIYCVLQLEYVYC